MSRADLGTGSNVKERPGGSVAQLAECSNGKREALGSSAGRGRGWSGGAMVLSNFPVPGRPVNLDIRVGQGPTALAVCAGEGCLDIFSRVFDFSSFSLSLEDGPI